MENHSMDEHGDWSNMKTAIVVLVIVNLLIYVASYIA